MRELSIARESPGGPDLALLLARHGAEMQAETPPESMHMLDAAALAHPKVAFYVMREGGRPVAMGALKWLDKGHVEVKSMHVLIEERGRGLSRAMLDHLLAEAAAAGACQISLETGAHPTFAPARMLYEKAGFAECGPYGDYRPDPLSIFMTRDLPAAG